MKGAEFVAESRYKRVVAKKHVVVFRERGDILEVVRIVHGSQDLEAIAAELES
ncbi:MAG: type II toxin-antitoxin system RelE/ParE family toxin [Hyphomonadaceae bacterium]